MLLGKHRVILHAFAGRRRLGDIQHYLDAMTQAMPGVTFHTISVDIVISKEHGDLSAREVQQFWLTAIKDGRVQGVLAGPPCSTWSKARSVELLNDNGEACRGPRVVRERQALWGKSCLSLRELEAVQLGNILLQFCILALLHLVHTGGWGLVEHPALLDGDAASIWHLVTIHILLRYPGVRQHVLQQGHYGAPSPKPTCLMTVNLHGMESSLAAWKLTQRAPLSSSVGKAADGTFRTSPLKEYPPSMCASVAQAFFCAFDQPISTEASEVDETFFRLCAELTQTCRGAHIGADTAAT